MNSSNSLIRENSLHVDNCFKEKWWQWQPLAVTVTMTVVVVRSPEIMNLLYQRVDYYNSVWKIRSVNKKHHTWEYRSSKTRMSQRNLIIKISSIATQFTIGSIACTKSIYLFRRKAITITRIPRWKSSRVMLPK